MEKEHHFGVDPVRVLLLPTAAIASSFAVAAAAAVAAVAVTVAAEAAAAKYHSACHPVKALEGSRRL
jgi:streptogramin lyase